MNWRDDKENGRIEEAVVAAVICDRCNLPANWSLEITVEVVKSDGKSFRVLRAPDILGGGDDKKTGLDIMIMNRSNQLIIELSAIFSMPSLLS